MADNLAILRNDFPKKDDNRDLKIYDERFFEIVRPDFEEYLKDFWSSLFAAQIKKTF